MGIICYDSEQNLLERLYQWDVNQTISVTGISTSQAPMFHFCNQRSEVALVVAPTMVNSMLTAEIPNILLREPETLFVYIYYNTGADGYRTFYRIRVPVVPRQKPQNYDDSGNVNFVSAEIIDAQIVDLIADMAENASASTLAEVRDIRYGYDGTTYQSAGDAVRALGEAMSEMDRTPQIFYFDTESEFNTYYTNNSGLIRPGDFIVINNETLFMKTRNSFELLISKGDLYKKPSGAGPSDDGIPMSDLSTEVQLAIASGSGSGEVVYVEGNSIKIFGFNSENAYNEYKTLNPNAIHDGDYVWIKNITPFSKAYKLFVVDSQATGGKTLIFTIDDTFLITVSNNSGSYTADHTFAEALQAYYDGKTPALLTDYGTVLQVSKYATDTYGNPAAIEFSGVLHSDGVFYSTTYILSSNGLSAVTQAVGPVIIDVNATGVEGVFEIAAINGVQFSGGSNFNTAMYVSYLIRDEHALIVLKSGDGYYPYLNGNQQSSYFGTFDPFNQVFVLFSWTQGPSFIRNELPMSSGGGSGSSSPDIIDGSILKRYLAADVQTSLAKADSAVQNNFGSANSGKPIVVSSAGQATVGSWPSGGSGGGSYSGPAIDTPTANDAGKLLTAGANGSTSWQTPYSKLIVSYNSLNHTVDVSPAEMYPYWVPQTGNGMQIVLRDYDMGDYEIPLVFIDSGKTNAVFSGTIRNYSTGEPRNVVYYVSSDKSATKTIGGSCLPIPLSQQAGYILVANSQGGFDLTLPEAATGADGMSIAVKNAILNCFRNVAWVDSTTGPAAYAALDAALFPAGPELDFVSISAVYTQGGMEVTPDTPLSDLKANLVVTATYDDSSTETITTYQLSGTLAVGTSAVTVTYGGLTTTFNVTVTAAPELLSISAAYTQGNTTVYTTSPLNGLKTNLVVTALYDDSSSVTLNAADYTLSGTLSVGTSTVTVSYGGKTATFTVTVTQRPVTIPSEYQEVDYIESTGTQYIVLDNNFGQAPGRIAATVECAIGTGSSTQIVIGIHEGIGQWFGRGANVNAGFGTGVYFSQNIDASQFHEYELDFGQSKVTCTAEGETIERTYSNVQNGKLTLFAGNNKYFSSSKIRSCTIYVEGTLTYDLVPCYLKSNETVGMYDKISETFFTNEGTGTFLKGVDV